MAPKRSNRARGKDEAGVKGGAGIPVNSWTMARKLEVSVVRTVVGARLEARVRFLGLRREGLLLVKLGAGGGGDGTTLGGNTCN